MLDPAEPGNQLRSVASVMTAHDDGLITLALDEADDVEREKRRSSMHEPYRTLLGHFRHEVGHFYWDRLVRDGDKLEPFRHVFGDERIDYEQALRRHYANGAPANWQDSFVTSYATSHPWEDFAETWAHYLHIVDTLEMAAAFGIDIHPALAKGGDFDAKVDFDPYGPGDITRLIDTWIPMSNALNNLNRTMGQPDVYPFILSPPVIVKLGVIHDLVHGGNLPVGGRERGSKIICRTAPRGRDREDRQAELFQTRNLKMARSAHAYVRGSTVKFYEWLEDSAGKVPTGPPIWICGDCHVGNLGPLADAKGRVAIQIRDLDQTVIGNSGA